MKKLLLVPFVLAACNSGVKYPDDGKWPQPGVASYASRARFAITNNLSDTLSFVAADGPTAPSLLGDMPVGDVPVELEGPHHIAAAPDGASFFVNLSNYVPGTGSGPHGSHGTGAVPGSVLKLDARTGAKLGEALVDRSPGDVIVSRDGKTVYVTHYDLLRVQEQQQKGTPIETAYSTLAIVDVASMERLALLPVCVTAHGEDLSPDGNTLYVTCAQTDEIVVVDVTDRNAPSVKQHVPVGPNPATPPAAPKYSPYALAVNPADGTVWVSNNLDGTVRVYDPAQQAMDPARVVPVGGIAMFGSFTSDGKTFYVPHQGDDKLTAIETATLAKRDLPLPASACLNAHAFQLEPNQATGIVVCEGDHKTRPGTIVSVSTTPFVVNGFVNVGLFSDGAAWLPPAP